MASSTWCRAVGSGRAHADIVPPFERISALRSVWERPTRNEHVGEEEFVLPDMDVVGNIHMDCFVV